MKRASMRGPGPVTVVAPGCIAAATVVSFILSTPAAAGDVDSLWFGGIDENGLAVQGGIWDFEDGTLQGWTSTDLSDEGDWFRHVTIDSCTAHAADGCPVITEGSSTGSMWLGAFEDEAMIRCWPGGQGYTNRWNQELRRTYAYSGPGAVTITFDYFVDSETQFDYTYVYADADGVRTDPVNTSSWSTPEGWGSSSAIDQGLGIGSPAVPARDTIVLDASELPPGTETFTLAFVFESDPLYSDGLDSFAGFLNSRHGPFGVDDIHVVGGGLDDLSDFEPTGTPGEELDGWVSTPMPGIGTYLAAVPLTELDPPDVTGACPIAGTVMVAAATDGSAFPHPEDQLEEIVSNPLYVGPGSPAHASGLDRWLVRWDAYEDLPLVGGVSYGVRMHYYPWTCPATGVVRWTLEPAGGTGRIYSEPAGCWTRVLDNTAYLPSDVDSVKVVFSIVADCDEFAVDCVGFEFSNQSPYLDHVQIGLAGVVGVDDTDGPSSVGRPGILGLHPNPIRSGTTLRYAIDARTRVRVDVLDVTGRTVTTLVDASLDPGVHTTRWVVGADRTRTGGGGSVAPGVYWIRLRAGDLLETRRAVVTGR